eukprot:jgi/Bigna1/49089/estExt_Genewise1.C_390073
MSESIKCVVVGDGNVGKTCLLVSYTKKCFPENSVQTVFDSVNSKLVVDEKVVNLNIWDTAAKDVFNRLRPTAYGNTDVFLVVFSIDQPASLDNVRKRWAPELQHYSGNSILLLIGNKSDKRHCQDTIEKLWKEGKGLVSRESAIAVANAIGAQDYHECSALTTEGLKTVFDEAIQQVLKKRAGAKKGKLGQPAKRCIVM